LNIQGDDLGVLIGRRGQALSSLQYMVKLIIAEKFKLWAQITVDIEGYKKRRYEALKNLALRVADQVKNSKRSMNLEPMPADERRIIHLALADNPDVSTHSIDYGERRKVVIQLRKN
jgi:spoIIIJ-associated protein